MGSTLLCVTERLFSDDGDIWPRDASRYYLGTMPAVTLPDPVTSGQRRMLTRAIKAWHLASIRLAGRIWGQYKRKTGSVRRTAGSTVPIMLPAHLAYLLL